MITTGNQVIRLKAGDIRKTGRDAKGVRLQRLGEGDEVIAITNLGTGRADHRDHRRAASYHRALGTAGQEKVMQVECIQNR